MTYFSGSAITRQERSIRGDIQTLDCIVFFFKKKEFIIMVLFAALFIAFLRAVYCTHVLHVLLIESFIEHLAIAIVQVFFVLLASFAV